MAPTAAVSAENPATAPFATVDATPPSLLSSPSLLLVPPSTPDDMPSPNSLPALAPVLPNSEHISLAKPFMDGISVMHAEPTLVAIPHPHS